MSRKTRVAANLTNRKNVVAMELFTIVCKNGGEMDLSRAVSSLSHPSKEEIKRNNGASRFIQEYFSKILKVYPVSDGSRTLRVEVIMPFAFCQDKAKGSCGQGSRCTKLHLCPYYLKGACTFKDKCRLSHNVRDAHTMSLLQAVGLNDIGDDVWGILLGKILDDTEIERGAASHQIPNICKFYNNEGGCTKKEKCPFLHVCRHFVEGDCKFGFDCKRSHHLMDPHNQKVLEKFGLGGLELQKILYLLKGSERSRTTSSSSDSTIQSDGCQLVRPTSQGQKQRPVKQTITTSLPSCPSVTTANTQGKEICGFFLKGKCHYGEKCVNLHRELPYQWQFQEKSSNWQDFPEDLNMTAEYSYCDLKRSDKLFINGNRYQIQFDELVAESLLSGGPKLELRRVSTQSSEEAPPGHIFSTHWSWYWKDEDNVWQSYDSPGKGIEMNTTCSKSLEKDFLQGKETHGFSAGKHSYTLYYKKMLQKNVKFFTEKSVIRRPEFVAKDKMKEIAQRRRDALKEVSRSRSASASSIVDNNLPPHWAPMEEKSDFYLEPLSVISQEYKDAETKFQTTMVSPKTIVRIERIQNPDLWTAFSQKKARMTSKASGKQPEERAQLFHGTSAGVRNAICQQGFDWRMCGKHGTVYGQGSYFACQASYSHRYTDHSNCGLAYMFIARVLVGEYEIGRSSFTRPPPKDPSKPHGALFDSCVNDKDNPSIFVIFENSQAYPEYLITYN